MKIEEAKWRIGLAFFFFLFLCPLGSAFSYSHLLNFTKPQKDNLLKGKMLNLFTIANIPLPHKTNTNNMEPNKSLSFSFLISFLDHMLHPLV